MFALATTCAKANCVEENAKWDCAKRDLSKRMRWNKEEIKHIMRNLDVLCVIMLFQKNNVSRIFMLCRYRCL